MYYKNGSAFGMHTNLNLRYSLKETIYALFQRGKWEVGLKGRKRGGKLWSHPRENKKLVIKLAHLYLG